MAEATLVSKILVDQVGTVKLALNEAKDDKRLYAEGKVGQCDIPTANGRVYTRQVMQREINRLQERINSGSLFCAVDHPGDGRSRISEIGAIVRKLWIENDGQVFGKFEIIEEGVGKHLGELIRRGGVPGMSSRGMGSTFVNEEGKEVVGDDFRLVTYDFVSDPAVSTAFPRFFTEEKELDKVTSDDLRAKFPAQVKAIMESAHDLAKSTVEEAIRADMERDVEKALSESKDKLKEAMKVELYSHIVKEMRDDYGLKLVKALQTMRKEVEESVRSELSSDPSVAGAKLALEQVAKLVSPYNPTPDVKQMLGEKDTQIKTKLSELEETKKAQLQTEKAFKEVSETARNLGYELYTERALSGKENAQQIRESIGDVSNVKSVEELKSRVEKAVQAADKVVKLTEEKLNKQIAKEQFVTEQRQLLQKNSALKLKEEKSVLVETLNTKVAELTSTIESLKEEESNKLSQKDQQLANANQKIKELEESVNKALTLAENIKYAADRSVGHPARQTILEQAASGKLKSHKDINEVAYDLEPSGLEAQIKKFLGKGREHVTEEARVKSESKNNRNESSLFDDFGVSLNDLRKLSGITS